MSRPERAPASAVCRRQPMIGTNMKMTMTPSDAASYLATLRDLTVDVADRSLFVLPPFPALAAAAEVLAGSAIAWGAQDVFPEDSGAHTGEVSAPMLADVGCTYVLVGHYERRRDRGESDELVARKAQAVQHWQMIPVICIGEVAQADSAKLGFAPVRRQLDALADVDLSRAVLAYEPAWAIGEGSTAASPEWIRDMHELIRRRLDTSHTEARGTPVISGGSISRESAAQMLRQPYVDGLFVGRNALDPLNFSRIIHSVSPGLAERHEND